MKIFSCIFLFISIPMFSVGQVVQIVDKSDLRPIQGVVIITPSGSSSATTDINGNADISVFVQSDSLYFSHVSYQQVKFVKSQLAPGGKIYMTEFIIQLDEVILSANKIEEKKSDIPLKVEVLEVREIQMINPQSSADLLQQTGKVFVQQSQLGGGSPILRGFEANKVLLVLDGVRLNNTLYRSGHLQNIITIDPAMLQKVEIIYGPGSVIYGSDALGGVMHFITRQPQLSTTKKFMINGEAYARFSSASMEKSGNVILNFGWKEFGMLTSISYKDMGDLRMGSLFSRDHGTWGQRRWYQNTIDGVDTMLTNEEPLIQRHSGYRQYDILQKLFWKPSGNFALTVDIQYSNSGNIPRYDRLTEQKGAYPKYAEWYYAPQMRFFSSTRADFAKKTKMYDHMAVILAFQKIEEDRVTRGFDASGSLSGKARQFQKERLSVASANLDLVKQLSKKNEIRYGIEAYDNFVNSSAYSENIHTGELSYDIASRYPDNGITHLTMSAYVSHAWEISEKLIFSQGVRYSYNNLAAAYSDTMFSIIGEPPIDMKNKLTNSAVCGSLGLVSMPGKGWRISASVSSGFRSPNADDAFKFNDSKSGDVLIVPNTNLKPEYVYNADLGLSKLFLGKIFLEVVAFGSFVQNAIKVQNFQYNGQDSTMWNGTMSITQSNVNVDYGWKYGLQADLLAQPLDWLAFTSTLTYTAGRDNNGDPLDHIPPLFGLCGMKLEIKRLQADVFIRYNLTKKLKEYNADGEDNMQSAPTDENGNPMDLPAWYTVNLHCSVGINKYLKVQAGVDNILDMHYRVFASGISAPGRNIFIALRTNF